MTNNSWYKQFEEKQKPLDQIVEIVENEIKINIAYDIPLYTSIFHYGAIGINPKHLTIWILFKTDNDKRTASENGLFNKIDKLGRRLLEIHGYPKQSIPEIFISFASEEEIEKAGGFRSFFA